MERLSPELKLLLESRFHLQAEAEHSLHRLTESLHNGAWRHLRCAAREQKRYAEAHPCKEAVLLQALCPFMDKKTADRAKTLCRLLNLLSAGEQLQNRLRCAEADLSAAEQGPEADQGTLLALLLCALMTEDDN